MASSVPVTTSASAETGAKPMKHAVSVSRTTAGGSRRPMRSSTSGGPPVLVDVFNAPLASPARALVPGGLTPCPLQVRRQRREDACGDEELERDVVEAAQDRHTGHAARQRPPHDGPDVGPGRGRAAALAEQREQVDLQPEQDEQPDRLLRREGGEQEWSADQREAEADRRLQRRAGRHGHPGGDGDERHRVSPYEAVRPKTMTSRRRGLLPAGIAAAVIAGCGGGDAPAGATATATANPAPAATATATAASAAIATATPAEEAPPTASAELRRDRFHAARAWAELTREVELGPRPAGSEALRGLAVRLRYALPRGAFERIPGHPGLRNVVGRIPGRKPAIAVAAHYDTKDLPGFVGANDGASGTAVLMELARVLRRADRPREAREIRFLLFDGEEATDDSRPFAETGLRGSKAYAKRHAGELRALILLDFVGAKDLAIHREALSDAALWDRLRAAARRVGAQAAFPRGIRQGIEDDHIPFRTRGVPAIDLIQWPYDCWHMTCDDLDAVEERSLDLTGETVLELVRTLRRT